VPVTPALEVPDEPFPPPLLFPLLAGALVEPTAGAAEVVGEAPGLAAVVLGLADSGLVVVVAGLLPGALLEAVVDVVVVVVAEGRRSVTIEPTFETKPPRRPRFSICWGGKTASALRSRASTARSWILLAFAELCLVSNREWERTVDAKLRRRTERIPASNKRRQDPN